MRQLAGRIGVSLRTTHKMLRKDLQCSKLTASWIPHFLTAAEQNRRVQAARDSIRMMSRRGPVRHVICGDGAWFHVWDPDSRRCNREWITTRNGDRCPKVVHREQSVQKTMLVIFFDRQGMVLRVFVPNGIGINGPRYLNIMMQLRLNIRRNQRQQFRANSWGLLHDGAPAHCSLPVRTFLQQHHTHILPHPPLQS